MEDVWRSQARIETQIAGFSLLALPLRRDHEPEAEPSGRAARARPVLPIVVGAGARNGGCTSRDYPRNGRLHRRCIIEVSAVASQREAGGVHATGQLERGGWRARDEDAV